LRSSVSSPSPIPKRHVVFVPQRIDPGAADVLLYEVGDLRLFARQGGDANKGLEEVDGVGCVRRGDCHFSSYV
jgi:hypothetical protein